MNISMKLVYQYMAFILLFQSLQIIFIHYKSRGLLWLKMTMVNSGLKALNSFVFHRVMQGKYFKYSFVFNIEIAS